MKVLSEIIIPKDSINDDEVLITDVLFAPGEKVAEGDLLLVYESSKASVEVEATTEGYVSYQCTQGEYVAVGAVVAEITKTPTGAADTPGHGEPQNDEPGEGVPAPVFSQAAQRYMAKKDISPTLFAGCDLVSLDDVLAVEGGDEQNDGRIPVVILGGGGHGLVLGDLVGCNPSFRLTGYLDDGKKRGDVVDGYPVLGAIPDLGVLCGKQPLAVLNAVGFVDPDAALRTRFFELADAAGALLPPFIHGSATVDPRATLGRGVQVHAGAVVGPDAVIEDGAMINTGVVISHHCRVGRHTHIAPGAVLAGGVSVGADCLVGMGVTAYLGITIGDGCIIDNGVDLFKSVPDGSRVGNG